MLLQSRSSALSDEPVADKSHSSREGEFLGFYKQCMKIATMEKQMRSVCSSFYLTSSTVQNNLIQNVDSSAFVHFLDFIQEVRQQLQIIHIPRGQLIKYSIGWFWKLKQCLHIHVLELLTYRHLNDG